MTASTSQDYLKGEINYLKEKQLIRFYINNKLKLCQDFVKTVLMGRTKPFFRHRSSPPFTIY